MSFRPKFPSGNKVFALLILLFAIGFASSLRAATIKGVVTDSITKETLAGVRVSLAGTKLGAVTGLDGSFHIRHVDAGSYTIHISLTGYENVDRVIVVDDSELVVNIELNPKTYHGEEVVVNGQNENGSDISAQQKIANSDNVISAVSARAIEISPDLSVAEVSQRVSGVTLTHNATGDAQYAVIRGMDQRYNYTTVNGIKIPSPDNKDNYVPLDIFPSDMVDRLEVYKTLLPSMEGDAVGGVMNLVMKEAPDRFVLSANAGAGYDGLYFNQKFTSFTPTTTTTDPRVANGNGYGAIPSDFPLSVWNYKDVKPGPNQYYGVTIGDRFLEDRNLGILVSGSYQNSMHGANTIFFTNVINQNTSDAPEVTDNTQRTYSVSQTRAGVEANIDYRLDENNAFKLLGTYVSLQEFEERDNIDTNLQLQYQGPGIAGQIVYDRRSEQTDENIADLTLSGDHAIFGKNLEAHWDVSYAKAELNMPDQAVLDMTTQAGRDSTGKPIKYPIIVDLGNDRVWENNADQHVTGILNLKTTEALFGVPTEFSYGGLYRATMRTSTYDDYNLLPGSSTTTSPIEYYNGNISLDTFRVKNPGGSSDLALDYNAHENITAGYLQARFKIGNLETVGGVRFESTNLGWSDALPATDAGVTGSVNYVDMLPSVSFKYTENENQNYRLSYFRSVNRPTFFELIPYKIGAALGDDYQQQGNPYLNRATADNVDIRWEYFPGGLDQLIVGAFFKNIQNPIEYAIEKDPPSTFYYVPENFGTATNYGFELDATKYVSVFGIKLNYTFTQSQITTEKTFLQHSASLGTYVDSTTQTRPLQGQAKHVGNLSLLYRDFENGTDAQLGLVYTGEHIVAVSPYLDNDIWQDGYTQLDFSAEQRLSGGLSLYLKVNNILNENVDQTIHQPFVPSQYQAPISDQVAGQNVLIRRDVFDRTYILGVRYKF